MIENDNTNTNGDVGIKDEDQQCSQSDVSNNNKWFIIVSPCLTEQAKEKLDAIQGDDAVNILCGTVLDPVDTRGRNAKKEDGTFKNYIECNGDSLTFEYKKIPMHFEFTIEKEWGIEEPTKEEIDNLIKDKVNEEINEGLFNEIFIEDDDNIKYGKIIHETNDVNNTIIAKYRKLDEDLIMVHYTYFVRCYYEAFKCEYKNNDAKKGRGILLIGNNNSKKIHRPDEQLQIGHIGVLNRYTLQDIISFSKTICDNEVILNSLSGEDKEKVKTIYENAINIDNIFKKITDTRKIQTITDTGEIKNKRIIYNNKQKICDLILDVISEIDNYNIDDLNQTFKQLIEECASWKEPQLRKFILDEICNIFTCVDNIYEQSGIQKQADVCRELTEFCRELAKYDKDKINTLIQTKEQEKNSRWGCIMKKRINEQIAYLNKMREQPLLYNSRIIDEISQRTPDSYTVSPCNFVQPWNKKENFTEVQKDILSRPVVRDGDRNEDTNSEYEEMEVVEEEEMEVVEEMAGGSVYLNNFRPNENLNHSYHSADRVNDFNNH